MEARETDNTNPTEPLEISDNKDQLISHESNPSNEMVDASSLSPSFFDVTNTNNASCEKIVEEEEERDFHKPSNSVGNMKGPEQNNLSSNRIPADVQDKTQENSGIEFGSPKIAIGVPEKFIAHDTLTCRDWLTECPNNKKEEEAILSTSIPEKDTVLWKIKDFSAFRSVAKSSKIPPLASPQFGTGCILRIFLSHGRKGHIAGRLDLPTTKTLKEGVILLRLSILKPDMKPILTKKVELKTQPPHVSDNRKIRAHSDTFRINRRTLLGKPALDRLIFDDMMRIKIEFQYYPYDSSIFRGLGFGESGGTLPQNTSKIKNDHEDLLNDIENYCKYDPSQYVELNLSNAHFRACRFLLAARSAKFRDILKSYGGSSRARSSYEPVTSLTITDISAPCLKQMIAHIHTDICPWIEDNNTNIFNVLELFEAADAYGMESLKHRLTNYLSIRLDRDNFVYMHETAERCNDTNFKSLCMSYMDSLRGSQVAAIMHASYSMRGETSPRVEPT